MKNITLEDIIPLTFVLGWFLSWSIEHFKNPHSKQLLLGTAAKHVLRPFV